MWPATTKIAFVSNLMDMLEQSSSKSLTQSNSKGFAGNTHTTETPTEVTCQYLEKYKQFLPIAVLHKSSVNIQSDLD